MESEGVLEAAVEKAREATQSDLTPVLYLWQENQRALATNQSQAEEIIKSTASGDVAGPL